MAAVQVLSYFLVLSFLAAFTAADCPFDSSICDCVPDYEGRPNSFSFIICRSPVLPTFVNPFGVKYTVEIFWIDSENVYMLPANYFSSFSAIGELSLRRSNPVASVVVQQFDLQAFDGVHINKISIEGIDGLLPPPEALNRLGARGLTELSITYCHDTSALSSNCFEKFPALHTLSIERCPVSFIAGDAFHELRPTLTSLFLQNLSLTAYPEEALSPLSELRVLDLSNNRLSSLPGYSLLVFTKLERLLLDGNPLADDINSGSLDQFPSSLQVISLGDVGFTSVPKETVQKFSHQLKTLRLDRNHISVINITDFLFSDSFVTLSLDENPISAIETGSFWGLDDVEFLSLRKTRLHEVDMQWFEDMKNGSAVSFESSAELRTIRANHVYTLPERFLVSLSYSKIENIDQSLEHLFKQYPGFSIRMWATYNLKCDGIDWIAPYVFCTYQVDIGSSSDTKCADKNDMPLDKYLRSVKPNPCSFTTSTSTTTTTTRRTFPTTTKTSTSTSTSTTTTTTRPISVGPTTMAPTTESATTKASTQSPTNGSVQAAYSFMTMVSALVIGKILNL